MSMASQIRRRRQGSSDTMSVDDSSSFENSTASHEENSSNAKRKDQKDVVWGKTPGGEVFVVPETHDVLTLFHPQYPKSHFDILNLFLLGSQIVLFYLLPRNAAQVFFFLYFAFWRASYDVGLGWFLTKQSKKKWIVRQVQNRGWLDATRKPKVRQWIKQQLNGKMGKDYDFDELPLEYNTWLLFRQVVDVILLNDFVAYCMFGFACFRVPDGLSGLVHVLRWLTGFLLIAFNLWVKTEAHDVVKDYGWYWGDCFFQRGNLVFDGVFELAPHPMYSVGYAGYYGLSLIVGNYKVLFVSLAAHAAQFGFLVFFENPHIERNYIKPKAIAKRTPIHLPKSSISTVQTPQGDSGSESDNDEGIHVVTHVHQHEIATPSVTEGDTATETEFDTEVEDVQALPTPKLGHAESNFAQNRPPSPPSKKKTLTKKKKTISQHDLLNKYFRRDTIILKNLDVFRANDFMFILLVFYVTCFTVLPTFLPSITTSQKTLRAFHTVHAAVWTIFHCFGLGMVLKVQSEKRWLVKHFLKNYYFERPSEAKDEAFRNWKVIYNFSLVMSNLSFFGVVWQTYTLPKLSEWAVGHDLLRHTLGVLLVGLHIWASLESYEVLGVFGWFFGDFFMAMEEFPVNLEYSGIYRYLNNPEMMGGAAWFGFSLLVGIGGWGKMVLGLAVLRYLGHWWFLRAVENPHMRKLYGDSLRKEAGFVKVMKSVASKNAKILHEREEIKRIGKVAKEVKGTFDKVVEETADVVEEFLRKSRPKIEEVVQDTKVLLMQSRERLVITRVSNDISSYDRSKYKATIVLPSSDVAAISSSSTEPALRFQLGEPIQVKWRAPRVHSRKDWVGIYRVGANKSTLVTKTSSMGMWLPVYNEEWDGDIFVGKQGGAKATQASSSSSSTAGPAHEDNDEIEEGMVIFKGDTLPWLAGKYEVRYHHDGKYNVMSVDGPFEIYVDTPAELTYDSVRECLMKTIPMCLDMDPALIPLSCRSIYPSLGADVDQEDDQETERDPDDFSFWSEKQAKRITAVIRQAFGVEYAVEVIVADANLGALTNRILVSKQM